MSAVMEGGVLENHIELPGMEIAWDEVEHGESICKDGEFQP